MQRRFKGEWVHKVDAKGRVSIPAQFRRAIEENDPDWTAGENPSFVIVHGLSAHPRLECFTMTAMDTLDRIVETFPAFSAEREAMEAVLDAQSNYVQLDENGRLVLSARLREMIGLADEAMLVGMGERFHIWDARGYDAFKASRAAPGPGVLALLDPARLAGGGA